MHPADQRFSPPRCKATSHSYFSRQFGFGSLFCLCEHQSTADGGFAHSGVLEGSGVLLRLFEVGLFCLHLGKRFYIDNSGIISYSSV